MLEPPQSIVTVLGRSAAVGDDSLTEDYGPESSSKRTLGGGVDFFSSLGKDVRPKKAEPDKPNPDQVRWAFPPQGGARSDTTSFSCVSAPVS
jgi:hypothetical protein